MVAHDRGVEKPSSCMSRLVLVSRRGDGHGLPTTALHVNGMLPKTDWASMERDGWRKDRQPASAIRIVERCWPKLSLDAW